MNLNDIECLSEILNDTITLDMEQLEWCGYSQSVSGTLDRPPDVWLPDGEIFFKDMSIRFERIHERDGRTGGHRTTA